MIMATVVTFGEIGLYLFSFEILYFLCVTRIQTTLVPAGQWTSRGMTFKCAFIISQIKRKLQLH